MENSEKELFCKERLRQLNWARRIFCTQINQPFRNNHSNYRSTECLQVLKAMEEVFIECIDQENKRNKRKPSF